MCAHFSLGLIFLIAQFLEQCNPTLTWGDGPLVERVDVSVRQIGRLVIGKCIQRARNVSPFESRIKFLYYLQVLLAHRPLLSRLQRAFVPSNSRQSMLFCLATTNFPPEHTAGTVAKGQP
jgi:hypothetical protein